MQRNNIILYLFALLLFCSCYHNKNGTVQMPDSLQSRKAAFAGNTAFPDFESRHHYGRNYNFVVKADSMPIILQQPEESLNRLQTDTVYMHRHDHIVVADMRTISTDPTDSVWIQVARDQETFGWIHEKTLLKSVIPNDPISQFISTFSDTHLLIFLIVISVIAISYLLRFVLRKKAFIVHFHDIGSIYPSLLAITVAAAATFYSSIQIFAADSWQQFYFHPSLNPFSQPPIIGIFIGTVWAMLILCLAAIDDVRHQLDFSQALLYLCGLAAICAANYIIFSITTLYYIGYPLLVAYTIFAIRRYFRFTACTYTCGKCGKKIRTKGKCPYCGAENR